ncbi:MAG: hypothetical protein H6844_13350 [Alphaproteobacteria bacterium]|nr:hypothetical protein [Alphaproteobacteria bacterium]
MRTVTATMTLEPLTAAQHQRLATWFGAGFPIGAFSYSHGLEAAFEAGLVGDRDGLAEWIEGLLLFGSGRNDAILFAAAYRSAPDVAAAAALAAALSPSRELRAETLNQGEAFLRAVRQGWPSVLPGPSPSSSSFPGRREAASRDLPPLGTETPDRASGASGEAQRDGGPAGDARRECGASGDARTEGGPGSSPGNTAPLALPVAAGLCCALAGIPLHASLLAYLHAFAANIVSAALRSMPIGQSDGLAVQGRVEAAVSEVAAAALTAGLDEIGAATPMLDWLSASHETQYSRLFRS